MADSTSSMPVGTTGAGGGNMLRITGLNTGLDIDAMVKKMLTADQTKVDNAKKQQQLIQWRQEAYQSIIKDVKDLQTAYFDVTNSSNYLLSSGSYNNMTAASSDSTIASAKAGADAVAGTYKVKVSQLAQVANITGKTLNSQVQITTPSIPFNAADWQGKNISFDVGGSKYTITLDNDTFSGLSDVVSNINKKIGLDSNLNGKVSASFININNGDSDSSTGDYIKFNAFTSTSVKIVDDTTGDPKHPTDASKLSNLVDKSITNLSSSTKLTDLKSSLTRSIVLNLNYNGTDKSVTLDNTDGTATIDDLNKAIKTATGGAVTGKIDDMTGEFILQTTGTGSTSSLSIKQGSVGSETTTDLLTALGLPAVGSSEASSQGKDALVSITSPGSSTATTLTETSNNFTVNGVSYSVTGTTPDNSPINVSVTQDTSKMHDLITNFIDKYNNIIGEIQDKLSEKRDYDYQPLTDDQKSEMSDTDITNWQNKAKQGVLRNDNNLEQLLNDLTSAFNTPVLDSNGKSVSTLYFGSIGSNAIGIDTSNDYSQGGKLSIVDDQKFTEAITNHADDIIKLFTSTSDSTDADKKFSESGIFQRINDIITNNVGVIGTTLNSGTLTKYANLQDDYTVSGGGGTGTLPDQIYTQQLLINTLTNRMNDNQTKYYNQFTQLETAMETLNAQQSTISAYFS
ncbi:MAG: flagellar filament capping protein FliD [Clostridium tyrobutyricum]|jgi:flagellar hook-associated protein 2|uniref:flagellar filament capping protein FliD n=1 Tax=Clostridium tyrobutyricum TaxID=1519 RepID=UPI002433280C|nr:flagellar filament capping protein FliD [Clostridium tyrobutyricum]MCH4199087.1 flagellar filament capping protein FliD [Clostridium tyrobutyricum]MCH4259673.1 flagellar filament capping protein FliD [Clostridium tyrobutyricum]MCI1240116.1 flagellar filament capping protein FliD [Clostridium tyrobutyricum]MCI1651628.1 flagellar filament capping protein FliD [Clostridium tyrobutyricum]MCI1938476.1 flagellar filament capping protein FliD [Clostridium tyrobutyricum]